MQCKKLAIFIFICLLLTSEVSSAGKDDATSPEALISQARLREDLWADGTPPIQLRAEVQILGSRGVLVPGTYSFAWSSPSRWREEIRFPGYERIRVGDSKGYWQKSALGYQPEGIFELDKLLHIKDTIKVGSKQTLGKPKSHNKSGFREVCTDVKWPTGTERVMCFDADKGVLVNLEYPRGEHQNAPEISRIEYGGFNTAGEKLVPYEVRALKDKTVVAAVRILEVSPMNKEDGAMFAHPQDAEFWAQCEGMQEATLVKRDYPNYPPSARTNREQGRVILYAVIEPDGSLSHATVIQRATPALEAAALEAISHWHYKPADCGQSPIRVETSIPVDFYVQY